MLLWLIFIQWPVLGILAVAWGIYSLQRRGLAKRTHSARWSKLFAAWNIPLAENELSQAIQDIHKSWNILLSWGWIGLGTAMTLIGLLRILQLLLTTGTRLSITVLFEQPVLEIQIFSLLIGYGAGYLHGLWQLRKRSSDRLAYGDLRPKRLTDYHSLAMQGIPACMIIYTCILLLVSMPYWKQHITIQVISGTHMVLPNWVVWIVPCLGVLLIVVVERFLWLIATFPRLLINMNLPLSARIDDMLRSLVSTFILGMEYVTIGMLNYALGSLLGLDASTPDYVLYMILVSLLLPNVLILVGITLGLLKGRIGGNLNGWPWQYTKLHSQEQSVVEQTIVEKQGLS
ncbi:MAG: hypothetical protein JO031_06845 [Ktedonobacteraceae bacterium]|nr:hypothetical protein [Ktedonobacteraceae bacterium]